MKNILLYTSCQGNPFHYYFKKYVRENNLNVKITLIFNILCLCKKDKIVIVDTDNYIEQKYMKKIIIPFDEGKYLFEEADFFIYQEVPRAFKKYSTDPSIENNLMSLLKKDCKTISFPIIYNCGFIPFIPYTPCDNLLYDFFHLSEYYTTKEEFDNFVLEQEKTGILIRRTKQEYHQIGPILKLKKQGLSLEETLKMYDDGLIDFEYEKRFQNCIRILKEKEKTLDIKISDFIIENRFKTRIFLCQYHPCMNIHIHCVNQIFKLMDINYYIDPFSVHENLKEVESYSFPLCSYDIKNLKLKREPHPKGDDFYKEHIKHIYANTIKTPIIKVWEKDI